MANSVIATVQTMTDSITVRDETGVLRQVTTGDQLRLGDVVLTENGQSIDLLMTDGTTVTLTGAKETLISNDLTAATASTTDEAAISETSLDQLINEISEQVTTNTPEAEQILAALQGDGTLDEVLEETAAGLTGESEGEGHSFVILDRVDEQIDLALTTTAPFIAAEDQEPFEGIQNNAPTVTAVTSTATEDDASYTVNLLTESAAQDVDGDIVTYVADSATVTSTTDAGGITISSAGVASVDPSPLQLSG